MVKILLNCTKLLILFLVIGSSVAVANALPIGNQTCGCGNKTSPPSSIENKFTDIAYATTSETQKLDIYLPNEGKGPFPVIIAFHGGRFY